MIKGVDGNPVQIANSTGYIYNRENNTVVFSGITGDGNKSYNFSNDVQIGSIRTAFTGTVTQKILYKETIEYISIPKKIILKDSINNDYVEGTIKIGLNNTIKDSEINVKVNPLFKLIYKDDTVKVAIFKGNSKINELGEVGKLNDLNKEIDLKLKANKEEFKYKNGVTYSGIMEFTFNSN